MVQLEAFKIEVVRGSATEDRKFTGTEFREQKARDSDLNPM